VPVRVGHGQSLAHVLPVKIPPDEVERVRVVQHAIVGPAIAVVVRLVRTYLGPAWMRRGDRVVAIVVDQDVASRRYAVVCRVVGITPAIAVIVRVPVLVYDRLIDGSI